MNLEEFCNRIELNSMIKEFIRGNILSICEYERLDRLFNYDKSKFIYELDNRLDGEKVALIFYVMKASKLYEKYNEFNIPTDIYFDTFKDITLWSYSYFKKYGNFGYSEFEWMVLHLDMKVFRLGRLEFETLTLEKDINTNKKNYNKGTLALNVHIPEGMTLDNDLCEDAFKKAKKFFGEKYNIFICESWLLSPNLKLVLNEDSNIIKFQNRFYIYKNIYSYRQAEERIFGTILENVDKYPEETSLQKKVKKYIKVNGDLGIGLGIFEL